MPIILDDYAEIDPRVYDGLQGITVQPFTEANVKNGTQFAITVELNIPSGTGDIQFMSLKTPNTANDVLLKTRLINTDGGMRYTPHIGAVFTPSGTPLPIVNLNGKSSNTSDVIFDVVTLANVSDEGAVFDIVRTTVGVGANRQQGIFAGDGIERVLERDTEYLLKFENLDNKAIFVIYSLTWYEGPLSVDL